MLAVLRKSYVDWSHTDEGFVDLDAGTGRLRINVSHDFFGGTAGADYCRYAKTKTQIEPHNFQSPRFYAYLYADFFW